MIEVFRRPEFLPAHADEIVALPCRPGTVWFQLGIRHDDAAERLARAGIRVVQRPVHDARAPPAPGSGAGVRIVLD